jgi:RNA polymerase sigma-70 factor, ECF subfamily
MSHSEIAEHLGVPLGTIKTRIRLGMRRLKGELDGYKNEL